MGIEELPVVSDGPARGQWLAKIRPDFPALGRQGYYGFICYGFWLRRGRFGAWRTVTRPTSFALALNAAVIRETHDESPELWRRYLGMIVDGLGDRG